MRDDWRKAAISGDHALLASLLVAGVDVNQRDRYGQTALMLAARHGREKVVDLLLQHGAEPDVTARYHLSALMLAVVNRHSAVARMLVDAGANTRLRASGAPGFAGKTAGELAEQHGLAGIARYISGTRG
jgi:ankyrin repeat protein